jgi:hypothetical protein
MKLLEPLGVSPATYQSINYGRTREIGDAAAFLGFDGLLVPNARWRCTNLILVIEGIAVEDLTVRQDCGVIDLRKWRSGSLVSGT